MKSIRNKKGFTLVEIMIVVAIIGILAAIAIPNFIRARIRANATACVNNLKQLDGAKQQWALEYKRSGDAAVTLADLTAFLRDPEATVCPSNDEDFTDGATVNEPFTCPNYDSGSVEFSSHIFP